MGTSGVAGCSRAILHRAFLGHAALSLLVDGLTQYGLNVVDLARGHVRDGGDEPAVCGPGLERRPAAGDNRAKVVVGVNGRGDLLVVAYPLVERHNT
eukprot:scaffold105889_cov36-Phaeocystis_antarctica.AAC.1